jgi:hypothetical protein
MTGEWEPITAFLKDWSLVIFSVILSASSIALAVFTYRLTKITKAIHDETEAGKARPILAMNSTQPLSDSNGSYARFSVKNIGKGHATNVEILARLNGKRIGVKPHTTTNVVEKDGGTYYWDVYNVEAGQVIETEIIYRDIRDASYIDKMSFTVI